MRVRRVQAPMRPAPAEWRVHELRAPTTEVL
jgi:hypothetical protein